MEIEMVKIRLLSSLDSVDVVANGHRVEVGQKVIVSGERGKEMGVCTRSNFFLKPEEVVEAPRHIEMLATEEQIKKQDKYSADAEKLLPQIKQMANDRKLRMKILRMFANFDDTKYIVIFSAEERVDFRDFVKDLAGYFKKRIELKQVGPRDEVRLLGGYGVCGKECCCRQNFGDFEHVSIKMAKNQNLSLSPSSISGVCGKLLCCLAYENQAYQKMAEKMPKINSIVSTKMGRGKVVYNDLLKVKVSVRFEDGGISRIEEFPLSEVRF